MKSIWQILRADTLMKNAFYLMLSTSVMAATGFIFWIFIARSYDPQTVGLATTLLSVSGLLSLLGMAGFDTTFVRFLPHSDRKQEYINSGFIVVALVSAALSIAAALVLPLFSSHLVLLRDAVPFAAFILFTVVASLNLLANTVFLAHKRARAILFSNIIFGVLKIGFALLVVQGNAVTIFVLIGLSQLCALLGSLLIIRFRLGHMFMPQLRRDILRTSKKYSFAVYMSSILNLLPPTLLPVIIVRQLGPEHAAYYYMAFTIAGALYTISYASMQSAFAESSHNEPAIRSHIAKAAKLVAFLLVPTAMATAVFGASVLRIFGDSYAAHASSLLQLFAIAAIPVAVYSAMGAVFKVVQNLRGIIAMNAAYAATIICLSYLFVPRFGIVAIGWSWLAGNLGAIGVGLVVPRRNDE